MKILAVASAVVFVTVATIATGVFVIGVARGTIQIHRAASSGSPNPASAATPYVPGTVIASLFGALDSSEPFEGFASAERRLGWRIMRPGDPRFHLVQGRLRTDPAVGLPRIEQDYAITGKDDHDLFSIVQQLETSETREPTGLKPKRIGGFEGAASTDPPVYSFHFISQEMASGQRVRVVVYTVGRDYTWEEFESFIASLSFGDATGN